MTAGRVGLGLATLVLAAGLGGCGQSAPGRPPDIAQLPLVPGASVAVHMRQCDKGANAFCAVEAVVVAPRYKDSLSLVQDEKRHLLALGWAADSGDTGEQKAAESPGHKLRLTYATALGDLKGIDLEWIKRPRPIGVALARAMFDGRPAMSVLLEPGAS
jgi:hypothetical protein